MTGLIDRKLTPTARSITLPPLWLQNLASIRPRIFSPGATAQHIPLLNGNLDHIAYFILPLSFFQHIQGYFLDTMVCLTQKLQFWLLAWCCFGWLILYQCWWSWAQTKTPPSHYHLYHQEDWIKADVSFTLVYVANGEPWSHSVIGSPQ